MKKALLSLFFVAGLIVAGNAAAANVDVGINLNFGAPDLVIESPPEFLLIPSLGLHISIGAPYDLFYLDGFYYHFQNNRWYRSSGYQGPWGYVDKRYLPNRMRKHDYREMLNWRDRDYQEYKKDREHHRDRSFRPEGKRAGGHEGRNEERRKGEQGGHGHKEKR